MGTETGVSRKVGSRPRKPGTNGESTKDRILRAAETLFADRGYKGAVMRDIAELSGVNLALANYHWGSKEALWNAVRAKHMGEVMEFARALAVEFPTVDSPETVGEIVHRLFHFIASHPKLMKMMAHAGTADAPPEAMEGLGPAFLKMGVKYLQDTGVWIRASSTSAPWTGTWPSSASWAHS